MKRERKGYTLVEILVVVVLFGLLFAAVFEILSTNRIAWDTGSTTQNLENQAFFGLNNMARELYNTNSGRITIEAEPGAEPNQRVTFQVPVGYDANGDLLWGERAGGTENFSIRYTINNNQLLRQVLDENDAVINERTRVLASDVQGLLFSPLNNNLLTITLTTGRISPGNRPLEQTMTSEVAFRN